MVAQPSADAATRPSAPTPSVHGTVGGWMSDVLGQSHPSPTHQPAYQPAQQSSNQSALAPHQAQGGAHHANPHQPQQPAPDLQSRLAAIARNIETLESRVTGAPAPHSASHSADRQTAPDKPDDPLEALRRRKHELDRASGAQAHAQANTYAPAPSAGQPVPQPAALYHAPVPQPLQAQPPMASPVPAQTTPNHAAPAYSMPNGQIDQLASRLDEQFARLTGALGDVRELAQLNARALPVLDILPGLQSQIASLEERLASTTAAPATTAESAALAQLSAQIKAVQAAVTAMPASDAFKSLEEGYRHSRARLDGLKGHGAADDKMDALYREVTALREQLDGLGGGSTASVVDEVRVMLARLERDPQPDADRIAKALEAVSAMAKGANPAGMQDAIGAVVERLVALEARIDALASGALENDGAQMQRVGIQLDAIQTQMGRLATFETEVHSLSGALETIRHELRQAKPGPDLSGL